MQKLNSNPTSRDPLGVRTSVWFIVGGLLVMCVLVITKSRRDEGSPKAEAALPRGDAIARDLSHARNDVRLDQPMTLPEDVFDTDAQGTSSQTRAAISNELRRVQEKLTELRRDYGDGNPTVKEQMRAIESLEHSAQTPGETVELAMARADLARLEVSFGPGAFRIRAAQAAIQSLEQSAAGEVPDLAQAKAQLARLRVKYGDQNPAVQSQLERIAELQQ